MIPPWLLLVVMIVSNFVAIWITDRNSTKRGILDGREDVWRDVVSAFNQGNPLHFSLLGRGNMLVSKKLRVLEWVEYHNRRDVKVSLEITKDEIDNTFDVLVKTVTGKEMFEIVLPVSALDALLSLRTTPATEIETAASVHLSGVYPDPKP